MCAETTRSENVRTEGLSANVSIEARSPRETRVSVVLRVGGVLSNLYPEIAGGDRLEATSGADTAVLTLSKHLLARPTYDGVLPGDVGGRPVAVRLLRTSNTSALGTRVIMPDAFAITSPPAGEALSSARPSLVIAWTPPRPGIISWSLRGGCILDQRGDAPDDAGRLTIALTAGPPPDGGRPATSCAVTVRLERVGRGTVDPAFGEGGSIDATQSRDTSVTFAP
jgi:hypothetical protein